MSKRKVPDTSKEAYASLDPAQLNETYRKILYALAQLGEATSQEAAAFSKVDHAVFWKRMVDLERMELIYKPGTKRLLKSGRMGYCYRLKGAAIPITLQHIKALKGPTVADHSRKIKSISEEVNQLKLSYD